MFPKGRFTFIGKKERAGKGFGPGLENGRGLWNALPYQRGDTGLENAGLLPGNLLQGISEERHVVKADGRDYGKKRLLQDIGAVQAATQAGFDDGDVYAFVGKPAEGHAGSDFKEGKLVLRDPGEPAGEEVENVLLGDHSLSGDHALTEIQEVGRCEKACLEAAATEGRCQHIGHGTFAVGAGNVDAAKCGCGMPQRLFEGLHAFQAGLVGAGCETVFLHRRKPSKNILYECLITGLCEPSFHSNTKIQKIAIVRKIA